MSINWFKKSKNNNSPIIVFTGRCSNCGAKHQSFEKNEIVDCCLERVKCDYAVDLNEDKTDVNYGLTKSSINNGKTAYYINEGVSEKDSLLLYLNSIKKIKYDILFANSILSFGKFKGQLIKDIDFEYIKWCINNLSSFKLEEDYLYELIKAKGFKNENNCFK